VGKGGKGRERAIGSRRGGKRKEKRRGRSTPSSEQKVYGRVMDARTDK